MAGTTTRPTTNAHAPRHPWHRAMLATAVAASLVVAFGFAGAARGATYKWVDEKGVIHYTDKIPPEASDKGRTVPNRWRC